MPRPVSPVRSSLGPRQVRPLRGFNPEDFRALDDIGIEIPARMVSAMIHAQAEAGVFGMDALQPSVTTPSIPTPIQFLQNWLPGFVEIITAARKIDELVGITTTGAWEDEEIVQGVMELSGTAVPYGDYTNVPFSSWNTNFQERTVIRFEEGMRVGVLEEARASRMRVNSGASKREAATRALEIERNTIGFYGYNGGANNTYGFLNDPANPAYVEVAASGTGGGTAWSTKTYLEIVADLLVAFSQLRNQSQENIDPKEMTTILAVAMGSVDFLSTVSEYGNSVNEWLKENYPKCTVKSAPQLNAANAGDNVFYLYADNVKDGSTDGGETFMQVVPTKFRVIGVKQEAKNYVEDYSNATAGVWLKRPWAVVRYYGI